VDSQSIPSIPQVNWVEKEDYELGFKDVVIEDISEHVFSGLANHCRKMDKRYKSGWCWDHNGEEGNQSSPDGWYKYGTILPMLFEYLAETKDLQFVIVRATEKDRNGEEDS
jgi:hypothetical protein